MLQWTGTHLNKQGRHDKNTLFFAENWLAGLKEWTSTEKAHVGYLQWYLFLWLCITMLHSFSSELLFIWVVKQHQNTFKFALETCLEDSSSTSANKDDKSLIGRFKTRTSFWFAVFNVSHTWRRIIDVRLVTPTSPVQTADKNNLQSPSNATILRFNSKTTSSFLRYLS